MSLCFLVQKLNRKLVHISIGLVFMLCWPLYRWWSYWDSFILLYHILLDEIVNTNHYSSGYRGAILAAITPGVNIMRMILIGSGLWKDEATVKSMSRYGDYRWEWRLKLSFFMYNVRSISYISCLLSMCFILTWKIPKEGENSVLSFTPLRLVSNSQSLASGNFLKDHSIMLRRLLWLVHSIGGLHL